MSRIFGCVCHANRLFGVILLLEIGGMEVMSCKSMLLANAKCGVAMPFDAIVRLLLGCSGSYCY